MHSSFEEVELFHTPGKPGAIYLSIHNVIKAGLRNT